MGRGVWQAIVYDVTKSQTQLSIHIQECNTKQHRSGHQLRGVFSLVNSLSHYLLTSKALQCKVPQTAIIIFPNPYCIPTPSYLFGILINGIIIY